MERQVVNLEDDIESAMRQIEDEERSEYSVPGTPYDKMLRPKRRPPRGEEVPKYDEHLNSLVMSLGWQKLLHLVREQCLPIHKTLLLDYRMDPISRAALAGSLATLGKLLSAIYEQADLPFPDGLAALLNGVIK
jgi:hypothetical protein